MLFGCKLTGYSIDQALRILPLEINDPEGDTGLTGALGYVGVIDDSRHVVQYLTDFNLAGT